MAVNSANVAPQIALNDYNAYVPYARHHFELRIFIESEEGKVNRTVILLYIMVPPIHSIFA